MRTSQKDLMRDFFSVLFFTVLIENIIENSFLKKNKLKKQKSKSEFELFPLLDKFMLDTKPEK